MHLSFAEPVDSFVRTRTSAVAESASPTTVPTDDGTARDDGNSAPPAVPPTVSIAVETTGTASPTTVPIGDGTARDEGNSAEPAVPSQRCPPGLPPETPPTVTPNWAFANCNRSYAVNGAGLNTCDELLQDKKSCTESATAGGDVSPTVFIQVAVSEEVHPPAAVPAAQLMGGTGRPTVADASVGGEDPSRRHIVRHEELEELEQQCIRTRREQNPRLMYDALVFHRDLAQGEDIDRWHDPPLKTWDLTGIDETNIGSLIKEFEGREYRFLKSPDGSFRTLASFSVKKMLCHEYVRNKNAYNRGRDQTRI